MHGMVGTILQLPWLLSPRGIVVATACAALEKLLVGSIAHREQESVYRHCARQTGDKYRPLYVKISSIKGAVFVTLGGSPRPLKVEVVLRY